MRVAFQTFGCKANQYDTERMRQEMEAAGCRTVENSAEADAVVLNTCTVTSRADAEARRRVRALQRASPGVRVVVAGCSAALHPSVFQAMVGADRVVPGQDPRWVARAVLRGDGEPSAEDVPDPRVQGSPVSLVQIQPGRSAPPSLETNGSSNLLQRREAGSRGWLKIQDGCDRRCSFCATRLARGSSRSRPADQVVAEARLLARTHPELVLTGIHIGHYGLDQRAGEGRPTLARMVARLLREIPDVRFRLGSVEATEVDEALLDVLASEPALAPHLHMPLQSGSDPVLRRMRRWHTRDDYRRRVLDIVERVTRSGPATSSGMPVLGLGADLITGFPGETDTDHRDTVRLVEELPFTYLHVFPFSPREGTPAAALAKECPVPQRVAAERARELRELVQARARTYLRSRVGARVQVVVERAGADGERQGLTEDYLRLPVTRPAGEARGPDGPRLHRGTIEREGDRVYVDIGGG
jgi:threonylcarbamoyladenosine tRNA methylthiotransferase MtaB